MAAAKKLTDPKILKIITAECISVINDSRQQNGFVWDIVEFLIKIAKNNPTLLKESWNNIKYQIERLHVDKRYDCGSCGNYHHDGHSDGNAASKGLHFPPYPNYIDSNVSRNAVEKLPDRSMLADIAKNADDRSIRRDSNVSISDVEKLTDQNELAEIAKNDSGSFVRCAAVEKLTDRDMLANVAKNAKDPYVRRIAAEKLKKLIN
jgi:hypothetical protein